MSKRKSKDNSLKKAKRFYYLIAGIFVVALIIFFFFLSGGFNLFFLGPVEGECQIIIENVGGNKVDIVFFTNNISDNKVQEYINFFLASEPFINNKEKFNFYYAGDYSCEIIEEKAVNCYSKGLLKKSSICPNDFIIALSNIPKEIRSSAYMNVMSLNINHHKNVVLHEFGHIFTNLADEYVPSITPFGSKNCQSKCEKFEKYSNLEGCYGGCGKTEFFRSTENSVMKTLETNDYGRLNTMLITEDLEKYE